MANPESGSVREERRIRELALRRDDILVSAAAVFAQKGYQGAQVAEIANAAETSLNSVYGLFKGKEELYEAVIHAAATTIRDRVQIKVDALPSAAEKLLGVVDTLFECFEEHEELLHVYSRTTHGLPWRVRQALGEESLGVFKDFTIWLVGIATDAKRDGKLGQLDPETVAHSLIGAVTTTAARWVEAPRGESLSEAAPKVRALFEALLTDSA